MTIPSLLFETCAYGKLLLTGEYFVLDGASALALPVRYCQCLYVSHGDTPAHLSWIGKDPDGSVWFEATFKLPGFTLSYTTDETTAQTLTAILTACRQQKADFLTDGIGYNVLTQNDFPRHWGLGTSSSLIAALARWAGVDPYKVLFASMGGSGYDIACANAEGPLVYRLDGQEPVIDPVVFAPSFAGQLYFIYLGQKQDSRTAIQRYRERTAGLLQLRNDISALTERCLQARELPVFEAVLREHEQLISKALDLPRARDLYFAGYWGEIKSLGAWGGDFVLATSDRPAAETQAFFNEKGFDVFIPYAAMVR